MQNNSSDNVPKKKIGIMGGTFNPIHNGHITLAKEAYYQFKLDKVLVMPSPNPPHKSSDNVLSAEKRVMMTRLCVSEHEPELEFSDYELSREGYVYTAETLLNLHKDFPDEEYYFILGGDSLKNIEKWHKPEVVMDNAILLAAIRDDMNIYEIQNQIQYLKLKYNCDIRILNTKNMPFSSTSIRNDIKNGIDVSDKLSPRVFKYIRDNGLYGYIPGGE